MNKKELAKLLFQHKDIKSLFESRQFDASTLKKVISEEIMREAEDDWKSDNSEETQAMVAQIEELKGTLNEFKGRLEDVKGEFTQAKVDRNRPKMKEITDEKKMIVADIDRLEVQIRRLEANLNIAYKAAGKTPEKEDDLQVAKIATAVKDAVSAADDSIVRSTDDPGSISKVAKDTSAKLGTAIRASDAVAKDKESPSSSPPVEEEPPSESSEEETTPQPPAGTGWKNAKSAARAKVTEDTTIEQIAASLESADAFKDFWGVKGEIDAKMEQAKGLFVKGYFAKRIEELKNKATEDNKNEVAEEAANLAATVMGYSEFLNNMMAKQPDFQPPKLDFPEAIPKDEEEFNRSFIQPLVKIQEPTDASVDKDGLKEEQYVELFTTNAAKSNALKSITEEDLQVFGGWYIMSRQSKSINEAKEDQLVQFENYGNFNNFWDTKNGPKFVNNQIRKSIKEKFRKKDPKLEATLAGIQTLIDSGQISIPDSITIGEDPNKEAVGLVDKEMVQDVIQNTPEVDPTADGDQSPLATEEMDAAWATTLDIFFGKSREYSSFMRQFLLKNQASMLYGMIDVLGQITTGGAGNEKRAYTPEKTQVKQKEQPAAPPAEAEKEANPPKTDTTTTDTSADDEETETTAAVLPESLEEQVINEIFGMFGGKDNEDKEIKFSPKSTSLMRQDLEAMVDLLRSLKTDIGQYKKYSTSSSVDPRFDGSTLKRAMDAKLKVVQQSIAHLTKVIDLEVQSQKDQLKADGAQAGQDSVDLQEASGSDRKVRIAEVEKVYNEMRRQYLKGLKVSLSSNDAEKAKAGAKELKNYVMGQETFMSYFPSNIITSSGGVMTLGAAHESMVAIIAPFIETIRDIVTITKTQKVSESNLQQAIGNLVMISDSIESMFKVPSLIDREFMKKYIEAAKQNPENQPLTDEEPTSDGEQSQVKPAGDEVIDFLKGKLGDSLNTLGEKFLNMFATEIEQDGATLEDQEEEVDDVVAAIAADIPWIQTLSYTQGMAISNFSRNLMDIRMEKQVFEEQIEIPNGFKDKMRQIAGQVDLLDVATIDEDMVEAIEMIDEEDRREAILKIMEEDPDGLSTHVSLMYKLGPDLGKEFVKELIGDPTGGLPEPESLPDSEGGDEPASADTINQALDAADALRGRSDLEDAEEEKDEIDDVEMAVKLGYKDGSEFASQHKDDIEKIIKNTGLTFRAPTEDVTDEKKAYDFAADSLVAIAIAIAPTEDLSEGFIQKTLSRLKSRSKEKATRRMSQRNVKTAKKILTTAFKSVSAEVKDQSDLLGLVYDWLDQFEEAPKKQMSLMKKLATDGGNIPKMLTSSNTAGEDSSAETSSDPMDYYPGNPDRLAEALRPIIEKMLNEHYNH